MKKRYNQSKLDMVSKFVKRLSFILLVSLVALWSCSDDDIDRTRPIPPTNPEVLDAEVLFEINMPQTMIPSTYALTPTEENYVKSIEILLFDVTTKVFTGKPYYCDKIEEDGGLNSAKKRFSVSLPKGGPYDIVILANSRQMVNDALVPNMSGKTLKNDVLALLEMEHAGKWVSKSTDANYIAIPMWGEIENKKVEENLKFNANLMRMLAKIDVVIGAGAPQAAFKLHAVHLVKANNKGHIVPAPANMAGGVATAPTLPSSATPSVPLTYLASEETNGERELKNVIYTFEATKAVYGSLPIATCVVLQGSYDGGGIENYYRLDFGSGTGGAPNYLDLIRNFRYDINVTKISGIGQPTLDDAIKNPSTNIIVDLTVWDNADFPIIIFDNTYSMGFSSDDITLSYKASNENRLKVMTDFPDGWKVDKILDSDGVTVTNWLSVTPTSGAVTTATDIKFDVTENTGTAPRVCYIYISAGPLAHKVKVTQETMTKIGKITWEDYDGITGVADGDTGFTSIVITDTEGNTYTPAISTIGNISPAIVIDGLIANITVVYRGYTLVVPEAKYNHVAATELLTITDRTLIGKSIHLDKVRLDLAWDYIQVDDVNLSGYTGLNGVVDNWSPIGIITQPFTGSYDGSTFDIDHLIIDRATTNYIGLFGYASGATLKNIDILWGNIEGQRYVAAICGHIVNGTIEDCTNAAAVTGVNYVGGISGGIITSTVTNCKSVAGATITVVTSGNNGGGIVGNNWRGTIDGCTNEASVSGDIYTTDIGGICGYNNQAASVIKNCLNVAGAAINGGTDVGGIAGRNGAGATIEGCTNAANISGASMVGGVVGFSSDAASVIKNCHNVAGAAVIGPYTQIGGLVGNNGGTIENCTNAATVSGTGATSNYVGGIVGYSSGASAINNCQNLAGATVKGIGWYAGGIAGYHLGTGTVENCSNAAAVTGVDYVGGLFGQSAAIINGTNSSTGVVTGVSYIGNICGRNSGTISGIINNTPITTTGSNIGGLVGNNEGTIENCTNAATVSGTGTSPASYFVGGIVGQSSGASAINNCQNLAGATVKGIGWYAGGIAGYHLGTGTVENCSNAAAVTGVDYVGGLFGQSAAIINGTNSSTGVVTGVSYIGNICGRNSGTISGIINNTPITTTGSNIGGLVGNNEGTIENCTNAATVSGTGTASNYVGGIVGYSSEAVSVIKNCQNLAGATVKGTGVLTGGIAGSHLGTGTVENCSNAAAVTGVNSVGGLFGMSAAIINGTNSSTGVVTGVSYIGNICGGNSGTISGIINNTPITTTGSNIGGLAGNNEGTIENCTNAATVSGTGAASHYVGGIVGQSSGANAINNCQNLAGGTVTATGSYIGGLVGNNGGTIENCTNAATVSGTGATSDYVGGIVGQSYGASAITNCQNLAGATVKGTGYYAGGIAGYHLGTGTVENCSNAAAVTGVDAVGGLFGQSAAIINGTNSSTGVVTGASYIGNICGINTGTVSGIINNTPITATGSNIGGLVGNNDGTIENCINNGNVSGTGGTPTVPEQNVGGICGRASGPIKTCINKASVSGWNAVGGIQGAATIHTASLIACYNIGSVTGNIDIGAIYGRKYVNNAITNCYYGGAADNLPAQTGAFKFSGTAWPNSSMEGWGLTPTGAWQSLGGWNGGVPIYPTLK